MTIRKLKKGIMARKDKEEIEELKAGLSLMVMMHFPGLQMNDNVSCCDCQDFRNKICPGEDRKGEAVLDCMMKHIENIELEEIGPNGNL